MDSFFFWLCFSVSFFLPPTANNITFSFSFIWILGDLMPDKASAFRAAEGTFLCRDRGQPAEIFQKWLKDTPGAEDFRVPDMTNVLSKNVIVTGIPNSSQQVAGIIGAFNVGLVVTMTSLPLVIPGEPVSTQYGTSFPSSCVEVVPREGGGIPFYEACMTAISNGVRFLHLPTKDLDPLPLKYMGTLQKCAHEALVAGKGVWLQCFYGHFRSWSAATFVLQRCGPEPRPLDPMPFLEQLVKEGFGGRLKDANFVGGEFLRRGPFKDVCRPFSRWDHDLKDVLWLLATHQEASAFILGADKVKKTEFAAAKKRDVPCASPAPAFLMTTRLRKKMKTEEEAEGETSAVSVSVSGSAGAGAGAGAGSGAGADTDHRGHAAKVVMNSGYGADGDADADADSDSDSSSGAMAPTHWLPLLVQERSRASQDVTVDSLLSFNGVDLYSFRERYDMVWLDKVCLLTKATLQPKTL